MQHFRMAACMAAGCRKGCMKNDDTFDQHSGILQLYIGGSQWGGAAVDASCLQPRFHTQMQGHCKLCALLRGVKSFHLQ